MPHLWVISLCQTLKLVREDMALKLRKFNFLLLHLLHSVGYTPPACYRVLEAYHKRCHPCSCVMVTETPWSPTSGVSIHSNDSNDWEWMGSFTLFQTHSMKWKRRNWSSCISGSTSTSHLQSDCSSCSNGLTDGSYHQSDCRVDFLCNILVLVQE